MTPTGPEPRKPEHDPMETFGLVIAFIILIVAVALAVSVLIALTALVWKAILQ